MGAVLDDLRARRGDPDDPTDQVAARREFKRQAGRRDRQTEHAYKAGRAGHHVDTDDPELARMHSAGATDAATEGRAQAMSSGQRADVAGEGAGVLVGLVAYAVGLNFIRGGMPAVRGWFAAKFLNRPYTGNLGRLTPAAPAQPLAPDFGQYDPNQPLPGPFTPRSA